MGILDKAKKENILIEECGEEMVTLIPEDFILDPKYFEWGFSETPEMKLRGKIVERLLAAKALLPSGWNFKIWDGFRTLTTQKLVYQDYWDRLKEEHSDWSDEKLQAQVEIFVSPASHDQAFPSPHNTGGTVDLTLIDENGHEVDMGTGFDEFKEASYSDYFIDSPEGTQEYKWHQNRLLLRNVLVEAGFTNYWDEWWHFSYGTQEWAQQSGKEKAFYGSTELC